MRNSGRISQYKLSSVSKSVSIHCSGSEAVTPVICSLLLLLISAILVGSVVSVFDLSGKNGFSETPAAKITLESCEGGLYWNVSETEKARLEENRIVLVHEGGSSLSFETTAINIFGYGNSYQGIVGKGNPLKGNVSVSYLDLSSQGKNSTCFIVNNKGILENGLWEVGERLILCGQDSPVKSAGSSVKVSVDGIDDTSDNYGFKVGSEITLKVIDLKSSTVLSEQTAVVKHVDG